MAVTIKDIAKLAGVSYQAVSAVLNGKTNSRVSMATRERIMDLAFHLHYRPNLMARSLRTQGGQTQRIGLICRMYQMSLYDDVVGIVNRSLSSLGWQVCSMTPSKDRQTQDALDQFHEMGISKIINLAESPDVMTPGVIGVGTDPGCDVSIDLNHGGRLAVGHLSGHGHSRICFVKTGTDADTRRKLDGCRSALKADQTMMELDLIWNENFHSQLEHLIRQEHVTAFIGGSDHIAGKLLFYFQRRFGTIFPTVGFGGYSFAEFTVSPLTTVVYPLHEASRRAVEKVLEEKPSEPSVLKPYLHIGESCGCSAGKTSVIYWEGAMESLENLKRNIIKPLPEDWK